jgi:hypothetical protein
LDNWAEPRNLLPKPLKMNLTLLTLLFLNTGPAQSTFPNRYVGNQIIVGSGGGVTGAWREYRLLESGYWYTRTNRDSTFTVLDHKSRAEVASFFKKSKALALNKKAFDHPGNLYYFVETKRGRTQHRVTWGASKLKAPVAVKQFYDAFMKAIPR